MDLFDANAITFRVNAVRDLACDERLMIRSSIGMKKVILQQTLKKLIDERGLTIRSVGRHCGIPQSTMNNLITGRAPHKPEQILALAQFFGVSMEALLFGEDLRPPTLDEVLTEGVFEGWLKVKIERAIPNKKKA